MSEPTRRVLVVDVDATTAEAVRDALGPNGFEIVAAGNAAQALASVREGRVDVVLSELLLPDDSGLHLLVESRLRHPLIPRIVVTALQDFKSAVTAINEAEVFRFLPKPLDPATVRGAIEEALGRADTLHEARGVREKAERRRVALLDLETDFPGITLVSHGPEGYFIPPQRLRRLAERLESTPLGEALAASVKLAGSRPS
jgi:DNA-binding NtrC family response regulator